MRFYRFRRIDSIEKRLTINRGIRLGRILKAERAERSLKAEADENILQSLFGNLDTGTVFQINNSIQHN